MASRKALEVGIRVGATDEASGVIRGIVNNANNSMRGLIGGLAATGLSYKGLNMLGETVDQFESKESALARVRIMTMKVGKTNDEVYEREKKWIETISSTYTGSIEDYAKMTATLLRYRISPEDVMGGVGEAAAKLGVVFDVPAEKGAAFFGKMKNDFDVPISQMNMLADMLSKVHRMGVGIDGADAINEMTQAFSKEGLAVRNLGMQGAKAVNDLGLLSAIFINTGQTGQSVGTNLRRILEGAINPAKSDKVRGRAREFGIDINFLDSKGNFAGIDNFVRQLSKLKALTVSQRYHVLDPLAGKQGLSTSMDAFMAKFGDVEFDKYTKFKNDLISIDDEFKVLRETLKFTKDVRKTNIENLQAAIGGSMARDMKRFNGLIANSATWMKELTDEHPHLATMVTELSAFSLGLVGVIGSLRALSFIAPVFGTMATGIAAAFGPLTAAAAAALILKEIYDSAETQRSENKGGGYDRYIGDIDAQMQKNKDEYTPLSALWRNSMLQKMKFSGAVLHGIMGDDYFEEKFGGGGKISGPSSSGSGMSYAPSITINGAGSLPEEDVKKIFHQNSQVLLDSLMREIKRQNNMTYGTR